MPYPLQPLLAVRIFRENKAMAAARTAQQAFEQAQAAVIAAQAECARYEKWLPEEKDRRYAAIMGQEITLTQMDAFKASLALLDDGLLSREKAELEAEITMKEHKAALLAAQAALTTARKDTLKIEAHRELWVKAAAKEAEQTENNELEEFTPAAVLRLPGCEEDS